jgi:hypothetical protein
MASEAASAAGDAAASAARSAADAAVERMQSAVCDWPVVGEPCPETRAAAQAKPSSCMALADVASRALAKARHGTRCAAARGRHEEYAGNIFAFSRGTDVCYDFDGPVSGAAASAATNWDPNKNPGKRLVANYHSHPMNSAARFSITDLCNYVRNAEIGYVVGTDVLKVPGTDVHYGGSDWTFGGDDRQVKRFDPNGKKFADSSIRQCLLKDSPSNGTWTRAWLTDWKCPTVEWLLDQHIIEVGTIVPLDDVPQSTDPCPAETAATTGGSAPPTLAQFEALANACVSL